MSHHKYFITPEKWKNRKAWCEKRGKLHDENRVKAKERKRLRNKKSWRKKRAEDYECGYSYSQDNFACRMRESGGDT